MRAIVAVTAALVAAFASAEDTAVLFGLRDKDGNYRSVLVARKGVAIVQAEKKGVLLLPVKEAVQPITTDGKTLTTRVSSTTTFTKHRVAWMGQAYIGLEVDATIDGQPEFTRFSRLVLRISDLETMTLESQLRSSHRIQVADAARRVREKNAALGLPETVDPYDWGYLRNEGRWEFHAALKQGSHRAEVVIPEASPTNNPPFDNKEVSWRNVLRSYPDATDVLGDKYSGLVVVVTPDFLVVHQSGGSTLGRELRRISSNGEQVVSFFFGGQSMIDPWTKAVRG